MTTPPPAVTDAEAIEKLEEWRRNCLDMIESHRAGYPPLLDFEIERVERSIAVYDLLLALARDGQRWRERRPNGYAVVTPDGAYCCELREDAVAWMFAQRGPTNELREIFFGPVEPVTPSAEVPGEEG